VAASPSLRRRTATVALGATAVVALLYAAVGMAVVALATRDLTAQVDHRLEESLLRVPSSGPGNGANPYEDRDPDRPFGAPLLLWTIEGDGTVRAVASMPDLPASLRGVTDPVTATVAGTAVRIAGASMGEVRVVVAQSMDTVADAQRTILVGWLLIAPFLLGLVFIGAVVVGRRVAAPIEAAHRRQLEFTADASHELRTPLSVIEAHTSLALAQPRDAAWYRTAFEKVERESRRMRSLLEDMLWLARFDAGQAPRAEGPVDLGVLAAQAADRFAAVAERRGLRISTRVPEAAVVVDAPADLVDRLLGVLIDNACKYAPDGGTVDVAVTHDEGRAAVTVDDSGPGVPPEDRDRIFDRFHRAVGTADTDGAGLGLAIGDAIVRATGGRWSVGASPSGGGRFSVSWDASAT
jgi:two-component system sensor histidine kinase CiaH